MTRPSGLRRVKREPRRTGDTDVGPQVDDHVERRVLRSKYLAIHNQINDDRDDLAKVDSEKFEALIKEVEDLHQQVQKPREQVADAEALLEITSTLISSVKSHSSGSITVSDFVSTLISMFGDHSSRGPDGDDIQMRWRDVGLAVPPIFRISYGLSTMVGPMNMEIKGRKPVNRRKRLDVPIEPAVPQEVDDSRGEEKTNTDKNMSTMFHILRTKKQARLEHLILNRNSFAQTVENLFALSFLVKDGRVNISLDDCGSHFVSLKNAPDASNIMSGKVAYSHFVFRFDFRDWKEMANLVPEGEELMPCRENLDDSIAYPPSNVSQAASKSMTPIRKFSRNRGLVIQENIVDDSDTEDVPDKEVIQRRGKRKLY